MTYGTFNCIVILFGPIKPLLLYKNAPNHQTTIVFFEFSMSLALIGTQDLWIWNPQSTIELTQHFFPHFLCFLFQDKFLFSFFTDFHSVSFFSYCIAISFHIFDFFSLSLLTFTSFVPLLLHLIICFSMSACQVIYYTDIWKDLGKKEHSRFQIVLSLMQGLIVQCTNWKQHIL